MSEFALFLSVVTPFGFAMLNLLANYPPKLRFILNMVFAIFEFALVVIVAHSFVHGEQVNLVIVDFNNGWSVGFHVEPLGTVFALMCALMWIPATSYAHGYMESNYPSSSKNRVFFASFVAVIGAVIGIAFAGDMLTMFIFYEVLSLITYPMVVYNQDREAVEAGRWYLGTLVCTANFLLLPLIVIVSSLAKSVTFKVGGVFTGIDVSSFEIGIMLLMCVYGASKVALMPLHRWLPVAMTAPAPVSAVLHAVAVVKSGAFVIMKILFYIFGLERLRASVGGSFWLEYVVSISVIVSSLFAMRQEYIKKLSAYSTIAQLSTIVLITSIFTLGGIKVAMFYLVAHGFAKICLFFVAGMVSTSLKKHTVREFEGLFRVMPYSAVIMVISMFAMLGLPPTSVMWAKLYVVYHAYEQQKLLMILVAFVTTILTSIYMLPVIHGVLFGGDTRCSVQRSYKLKEAGLSMLLPSCILAAFTIVLFVKPNIIFYFLERL